jgi:AcrR family transcriptional regulator
MSSKIIRQSPAKGGKRERTRGALVAATQQVLSEKGFAAASLDEIAARAGMTKGAIYSNFGGKADLLLAAMESKGLTLGSGRAPGGTAREELLATARDLAAALPRARDETKFLAEFQAHALADPELRRALGALYSRSFDETGAQLTSLPGAPVKVSARTLAVAMQAVALGFLAQSLFTPDEITEPLIVQTMTALADGWGLALRVP